MQQQGTDPFMNFYKNDADADDDDEDNLKGYTFDSFLGSSSGLHQNLNQFNWRRKNNLG